MSLASEAGFIGGDLSEAVLNCAVELTVTRADASVNTKGRAAVPSTTTFTANLAVQPMTGKELQMLPEGMRNQGRVKVYSDVELKTVETSAAKIPDTFVSRGVTYQIVKVDDWIAAGNYYRFEAVRADR